MAEIETIHDFKSELHRCGDQGPNPAPRMSTVRRGRRASEEVEGRGPN